MLTKESASLENEILQKDFDLNELTRQVDWFKKSYDAFSNKIYEVRVIKSAQLGEVKIISPAIAPSYAESKGGIKLVLFSGFLSFVAGLLLAFLVESWRQRTRNRESSLNKI